jgi:hypothetical protein
MLLLRRPIITSSLIPGSRRQFPSTATSLHLNIIKATIYRRHLTSLSMDTLTPLTPMANIYRHHQPQLCCTVRISHHHSRYPRRK